MTSSGEVSPASVTPAGTPSLISQAPKYGTLIPNRIFVGGIAANTTEVELKQYFMAYGAVKDCKIIADRAGVSKGYGFVTFETQEDAEKIIKKEGDNLIFKDRKLNIGPAIRKQAFTRMYEQSVSPGTILFTNGVPYTYQNGMAVFHPQEGYPVPTTPQPAYPVMVPHGQPMYVSQPNFTYQSPTAAATATQWAAASPWRWTAPPSPATPTIAASQYMYPMQTVPPEVIYAQLPPQAAFQPGEIADGSVIETAPAEYGYGPQYGGNAAPLC